MKITRKKSTLDALEKKKKELIELNKRFKIKNSRPAGISVNPNKSLWKYL